MKKSIRVSVTAKDIEVGRPKDDCLCPLALATVAAVGHGQVSIGFFHAYVGADAYNLPREAQQFQHHFDRTGKGEPITFTMRAV